MGGHLSTAALISGKKVGGLGCFVASMPQETRGNRGFSSVFGSSGGRMGSAATRKRSRLPIALRVGCDFRPGDQRELFDPAQLLDRRFPFQGARLRSAWLCEDQRHGESAAGVSRRPSGSVGFQPLREVVRDARVERAVRAPKEVDEPGHLEVEEPAVVDNRESKLMTTNKDLRRFCRLASCVEYRVFPEENTAFSRVPGAFRNPMLYPVELRARTNASKDRNRRLHQSDIGRLVWPLEFTREAARTGSSQSSVSAG